MAVNLRKGAFLMAALALVASCGGAPMSQPSSTAPAPAPVVQATPAQTAAFREWTAGFRPRALNAGISAATFDRAFANADYRPDVIDSQRNQPEFSRTLRQYLGNAVTDTRIAEGQRMLSQYAGLLSEIEARYNVDREVVVAIWGLESQYGARRGTIPTVDALATLAMAGSRSSFFAEQLVAALRILQNGDVTPERMTGSWAGAMGHTQFIPTSYQSLAADFRGDGRRDIWSDDPTDALASTARYLQNSGWQRGRPWGIEVRVPDGASTGGSASPDAWAARGIVAADGRSIPNYGSAEILRPDGASGPAFMIFRNAEAIRRYNNAAAYVVAVGYLSDRLKGGAPFQTVWPAGERALTEPERMEIQRRLASAGYYSDEIDGRLGPATLAAIRAWQQANGQTVTGDPSLALLRALGG
ncbi:lytic murein transglycosylase [Wenxinia marina]|uniref:Lytic murein transglycosylase n=1 Tax=Wenxinia marina DSM 24838 TaxID=1123501 RepID=A0A0D0QA07_9RHOB|nr:lytic murein transglycosylase [Wenxinia marina]KIQ71264.1 lytic murein transglycosylase [Wenxinia marina DSM 24838]